MQMYRIVPITKRGNFALLLPTGSYLIYDREYYGSNNGVFVIGPIIIPIYQKKRVECSIVLKSL